MERDSVDGKSQHQLNLSVARLEELIGFGAVAGLWRMADELLAAQVAYFLLDSTPPCHGSS